MEYKLSDREYRKLGLFTFKYFPLFTSAVMVIHILLLLFGINSGFAETFCGVTIITCLIAYFLSKGLGFCNLHRLFINYTCLVFLCIQFQDWIGFGIYLTPMRILMFLFGIGIFIYLIHNFQKFKCNKN